MITVSPQVAIIAPSACLAIFPVSKEIFLPFISISSLNVLNITSLNLVFLLPDYMSQRCFFLNNSKVFFVYLPTY